MNANRRKTESKDESFARIATARVNKISDMIRRLGNCSTVSNYLFTEEQVNKIFEYLQNEINKARRRFDCALHKSEWFRLEEEETPKECLSLELELPNGGTMRVRAIDDEDFPAMKVEVFENGQWCVVSETEYNAENESPMNIGVCIYENGYEDSVDYIPYKNYQRK